MDEGIITATLVSFLVLVNVLWYSAKFFIRKHGGRSNLFWGHFRDFKELRKLASTEYPKGVNLEAKIYLYGIPFAGVTLFLYMVGLVGLNV